MAASSLLADWPTPLPLSRRQSFSSGHADSSALKNIAAKLNNAGWSVGWVSAIDCERRRIWIADAHRGRAKRFVVRADEKLTAFLELESATRQNSIDIV